MRVVIAHGGVCDIRKFRRLVLGAGLDCGPGDCVPWDKLPAQLASQDAELVVVKTETQPPIDWNAVADARALSMAPFLAVGPAGNTELAKQADALGFYGYLDEANLRQDLDSALERLAVQRGWQHRGRVTSVVAPVSGSGGTTISANLAGVLAKQSDGDVGLIELTEDAGTLALLLDLQTDYTLADLCDRWERLDRTNFPLAFVSYKPKLKILPRDTRQSSLTALSRDVAARVGVISRTVFRHTILKLDSRFHETAAEAMRLSDRILLILRPDVPGLRKVRLYLDEIERHGVPPERVSLVANRWGQAEQLGRRQVESALGRQVSAWLPDCTKLCNRAANQGELLVDLAGGGRIAKLLADCAGESPSNGRANATEAGSSAAT